MAKGTVTRRLTCMALILVMLCALLPVHAANARYGTVNENKVRFRKTPTTAPDGEWWGMLDRGWVVMILEDMLTANSAYWYHVQATLPGDPGNSYVGYIMAEFLTEMKADEVDKFLSNPVEPDGSPAYTGGGAAPVTPVPVTPVPVTAAPITAAPITAAPVTSLPGGALGYIVLVKDGVNLREKPNGETLTPEESQWLPIGLVLPYFAEPVHKAEYDWVLVQYKDKFGYIRSDCYSFNLSAATTIAPPTSDVTPSVTENSGFIGQWGHTIKDKVFFRVEPGYGADVWELLPLGWNLRILGSTVYGGEIWLKVEGTTPSEPDKNHVGYIHSMFFATGLSSITPDASTPTPTPTPTPSPTAVPVPDDAYGFITVEGTILRDGPSTTAGSITALPYGQLAEILDHPAGFYHVKTAGKQGYVAESALKTLTAEEYYSLISSTETPTPTATPTATPTGVPTQTPTGTPPATPTPNSGTEPLGYIKLIKDGVNLREKPNGGTLTPEESQWLPKGQILPYYAEPVEKGGYNWILVWYKEQFGYIRSDCYMYTTDPGVTPGPTAVPSQTGYVKLNKGGVNVRKTPAGEVIGMLGLGTVLPYYGTKTEDNVLWYYVYTSELGSFGYIMGTLCDITSPPTAPPSGSPTDPAPVTISPTPGEYGYVATTANKVYLRESATTGSKALDQIPTQNTVMIMTGNSVISGGIVWYPVNYGGTNGFVHGNFSRPLTPAEIEEYKKSGILPTPTPEPTAVPVITPTPTSTSSQTPVPVITPTVSGYVITLADKLFVRTQPSTGASYLGQIAYSGTILQMNGSPVVSGDVTWYPVIYQGESGYVHGNFARQLTQEEADSYEKSGKLPTPTPAPTATPSSAPTATPTASPKPVQYLIVTTDKVFVRTGAGTGYAPIAENFFVNKDEVYYYDSAVVNGGVTWYHIQYDASTVGYVHGNFVKVMTEKEYDDWKKSQTQTSTPVPTAVPTAPPEELLLTLGSTGELVMKAQNKLVEKGYLTGDDVTGVYGQNTMNAVIQFQTNAGLPVNGNINQATWDKLFESGGGSSGTPYYVDGSSVSVVLNPVEMIDWYTGDIQTLWAVGTTAIVTDVYTGISFRARRWSGGNHADVEPLTSADTDSILKIYGVSSAQEISDRQQDLQSWRRRPAWITINGRTVAGSLYLVPHNYPDGDTIPDNNFNGQFCVHFINSKTHGNATNPAVVDTDRELNGYFGHQSAIKYAYDHSISGTK